MTKNELIEKMKGIVMYLDEEYQKNPNILYTAEEVMCILEELIYIAEE